MPDCYPTQFVDRGGFENKPCPAAPFMLHFLGFCFRTPQQKTRLKTNDAPEDSLNPKQQ
jgi:hypothetical protein